MGLGWHELEVVITVIHLGYPEVYTAPRDVAIKSLLVQRSHVIEKSLGHYIPL